ncbi:MAG: DUF3750 domain-containing protein [Bordetella sp.]
MKKNKNAQDSTLLGLTTFVGLFLVTVGFVSNLAASETASSEASAVAGRYTDWRTAPRHSAQLLPDPAIHQDEAMVYVLAARAFRWRGHFAVHPWVVFKRAGEESYTRYEVIGWGGGNVVRKNRSVADGLWFGAPPAVLVAHKGQKAQDLIPQIEAAIKTYPYPENYRTYPGPNSNTFLAHIGRSVPELDLDLPPTAIGKDFRGLSDPIGLPPSGQGVQLSVWGLFGMILSPVEGIELNILGLNLGLDLTPLGLRLPLVGVVSAETL